MKEQKKKPKIELMALTDTIVNTPTQEDYNTLMQVYECGGWKWKSGHLPTKLNYWGLHREQLCIEVRSRFGCFASKYYITPQEFYKKQSITQQQVDEIKSYFDENYKIDGLESEVEKNNKLQGIKFENPFEGGEEK